MPDQGRPGGAAGRSPARLLAYTVGLCLAGSGLALLAVTRVWFVQTTARPGLSDLRTSSTGADRSAWLPALALVGLAGAGALLATRGWVRRAIGALLAVVGGGLTVVVIVTRRAPEPAVSGAGGMLWPVAAVVGGVLLMLGGWSALRYGHRWPAMGARYERRRAAVSEVGVREGAVPPGPVPSGPGGPGAAGPPAAGGPPTAQPRASGPVDTRSAWDALDRGDDPTVS